MLQAIRNLLKHPIALVLAGVVVVVGTLAFLLVGTNFTQNNATWVAKVGGHEISQDAFTQAMNNARQRQLDQPGNTMEPADFQKPAFKQKVLKVLIDSQLVRNANSKFGIQVPDSAVRAQIASTPQFQVNGKFNADAYLAMLSQNGLSPQKYQDEVRTSLETQQLPGAIAETAFGTPAEADAFLRLQLQQRDFSYVDLPPPAATPAQSTVTDAQLQDYYKTHIKDFMAPEQVSVHYIDLDGATLTATPDLSDAALQARYDKEKSRFVSPPQWKVAHILISVPAKATAAQKAAALAKADKVDALAKAPGADFAKLAQEYSDDLGSKSQGGDLGWIQKGDTDPAFEAAVEKLQKGQVSAPVLATDGYHIIDLEDLHAGHSQSFAEVRDQLVAEATKNARTDAYKSIADKLTDMIYDDPTSLQPAAKKFNLKVQTSPLFGREGSKEGIAANPAVVKAAFSDTVLVQNNNSDPIQLGPDHIVVLRVDKHVPAAPRKLADIVAEVKQKVVEGRVDATAKQAADAAFVKLEQGTALASIASAAGQVVTSEPAASRNQPNVDPELLAAVFKLAHPAKGAATRALVPLAGGHFALVELSKVTPGDVSKVPEQARSFLSGQMAMAFGDAELGGFLDVLRKRTKVSIATDRM